MSGWDEFKSDAGKIASKAAVKASAITDAAAARIKLQGMKLHLCEEYEKLGRLTYKAQKDGIDPSAGVTELIAEIDRLKTGIKKIENDIKARREARTATDNNEDDSDCDESGIPEQD